MTSLLAGNWHGVADATVGRGMDWLNESVKEPVAGWLGRNEGLLRTVGHQALGVGVSFVAASAAVAACGASAGLGCVVMAGIAAGAVVGAGAHSSMALATNEQVTPLKTLEWALTSIPGAGFQSWFVHKFGERPAKYVWNWLQARRHQE
ncbi:hypothetical protein [Streptomyces profundus]|uniref:hypothetical protein n=1 Tax=Streptomyces profundus TaxID=2867410 RepID=UPI001D161430|nr:hypothetical protein [Streptomyces sp. MA3_2.13]UED86397.1 hypothetical protein K4G22_21215 [Streptomyces sp. MA3_2.13]